MADNPSVPQEMSNLNFEFRRTMRGSRARESRRECFDISLISVRVSSVTGM